jgi:hypothetical protein
VLLDIRLLVLYAGYCLLRDRAIRLLNEITTTYPELLASVSHISLQLSEGDTRLIIKSRVDFEQKSALLSIFSDKGLKVVDCPSDFDTVLVIY